MTSEIVSVGSVQDLDLEYFVEEKEGESRFLEPVITPTKEGAKQLLIKQTFLAVTQLNVAKIFEKSLLTCSSKQEAKEILEFWSGMFEGVRDVDSFLRDFVNCVIEEGESLQGILDPQEENFFESEKFIPLVSALLYQVIMNHPILANHVERIDLSGSKYKETRDIALRCKNVEGMFINKTNLEGFYQIGELKKLKFIVIEDEEELPEPIQFPASFYTLQELRAVYCPGMSVEQMQKIQGEELLIENQEGYYFRDRGNFIFHPYDKEEEEEVFFRITGTQFYILDIKGNWTPTDAYDPVWLEAQESWITDFLDL